MSLVTPHERGEFETTAVTYCPKGLYYSDPLQEQFKIFETPSAMFSSRYIDISAFASFPSDPSWPFDIYNVPINGLARFPNGDGPFPIIIFAHGNHDPLENSTPGYLYLCDLLASQGFIAATIDVNYLNGANRGENDGRAIIHLEHIKQFHEWNQKPGHPLEGKVDVDNVMIVGHSRGGEAVGHASYFNRLDSIQPETYSPTINLDGSDGLGPYKFNLKSVAAIAPTDGQYVPVNGPVKVQDTYFLIHGSRDGDVWPFPGQKTYDRSQTTQISSDEENFKSLLWIHGANHNYFNSVWAQESPVPTISRNDQERIISVYLSSLAHLRLLNDSAYLPLIMNHKYAYEKGWIPADQKLVSQYYNHNSFSIQNHEHDGNVPILNDDVDGSVEPVGIDFQLLKFDLGAKKHLYQETKGIRLNWDTENSSYILNINPESIPSGAYSHLSFRIGQSFEELNTDGINQDFSLEISDGLNAANIRASDVADLIFPDSPYLNYGIEPRTVMQSIIISFDKLREAGIVVEDIRQIKLIFNIREQGTMYMDDLALA